MAKSQVQDSYHVPVVFEGAMARMHEYGYAMYNDYASLEGIVGIHS